MGTRSLFANRHVGNTHPAQTMVAYGQVLEAEQMFGLWYSYPCLNPDIASLGPAPLKPAPLIESFSVPTQA
eukprot:scaffold43885_cov19-Tisochrysis_lutea.AAC.1